MDAFGGLSDEERRRWPEWRRKAFGWQVAQRRGDPGLRALPSHAARASVARRRQGTPLALLTGAGPSAAMAE
eukprot:4145319-Alexandrium_andersonii.AAC.1